MKNATGQKHTQPLLSSWQAATSIPIYLTTSVSHVWIPSSWFKPLLLTEEAILNLMRMRRCPSIWNRNKKAVAEAVNHSCKSYQDINTNFPEKEERVCVLVKNINSFYTFSHTSYIHTHFNIHIFNMQERLNGLSIQVLMIPFKHNSLQNTFNTDSLVF